MLTWTINLKKTMKNLKISIWRCLQNCKLIFHPIIWLFTENMLRKFFFLQSISTLNKASLTKISLDLEKTKHEKIFPLWTVFSGEDIKHKSDLFLTSKPNNKYINRIMWLAHNRFSSYSWCWISCFIISVLIMNFLFNRNLPLIKLRKTLFVKHQKSLRINGYPIRSQVWTTKSLRNRIFQEIRE
jgi:hypothetical protein